METREMTQFDPEDKRKKCLNIGSGVDYRPSTETELWVNIDINPKVEPDIVCAVEDLTKQFERDTFDRVEMIHVWEHVDDALKAAEQIWAVLKNEGELIIVCPYYTSANAMSDPTHKRFISPISYAFLSYTCYEANAKAKSRMSQLFPECDFDIMKRMMIPQSLGDSLEQKTGEIEQFRDQQFAIKHYFNVIEEMQVELKCVKPIRMFDIKKYQNRGPEVAS